MFHDAPGCQILNRSLISAFQQKPVLTDASLTLIFLIWSTSWLLMMLIIVHRTAVVFNFKHTAITPLMSHITMQHKPKESARLPQACHHLPILRYWTRTGIGILLYIEEARLVLSSGTPDQPVHSYHVSIFYTIHNLFITANQNLGWSVN